VLHASQLGAFVVVLWLGFAHAAQIRSVVALPDAATD
jgi:hypothetical protein